MKRYLKYGLVVILGFIALFAVLVAIFVATFDPNDFKAQITDLVKRKKQRTLTLDGRISLAFFPKLGIELGKVAISEHQGHKQFAALNRARLYLAWLPLLKKELVVDQVTVDGLHASLVRYQDGTTNFDDLLKKEEPSLAEPSSPVQFDIGGVRLTHTALSWRDELKGQHFVISGLEAKTGRLANASPTYVDLRLDLQGNPPRINTQIHFASGLLFDLEKKHYALDGLEATVKGQAANLSDLEIKLRGSIDAQPGDRSYSVEGLTLAMAGKRDGHPLDMQLDIPELKLGQGKVTGEKITLRAGIKRPQGNVAARMSVPEVKGTPKAFRAGQVTLEWDGQQGKNGFRGKATTPLSGSLETRQFELPKLLARLDVKNPGLPQGGIAADLNGNARIDLIRQDILANLAARLYESNIQKSNIQARLGISQFKRSLYTFDVGIDRIDVNRYMPPKPKPPAPPRRQAFPAPQPSKPPEKPLNLSALKALYLNGALRIGSLKFSHIKTSNVRLSMKADGGRLQVSPFSLDLYQGSINGELQLNVNGVPQVATRQTLKGVQVGPLLKDAANQDILEGKGDISLDVSTQGSTVSAMKKALLGQVTLNLVDGAIKGINLVAALRNARAQVGTLRGETVQAANQVEKTDFSELKATFHIKNGVAQNNDLLIKSPLLRMGGEGEIDLGEGRMNYLAKAAVVSSLKGQEGQDLAALRGVTIPVRAAGPFSALKYTLDFHALAGGVVKQRFEEKTEEAKKQLQEKVGEGLMRLFGKEKK